ncbi:hypothetical protein V8F06_010067 [Rhypophila decipiens]
MICLGLPLETVTVFGNADGVWESWGRYITAPFQANCHSTTRLAKWVPAAKDVGAPSITLLKSQKALTPDQRAKFIKPRRRHTYRNHGTLLQSGGIGGDITRELGDGAAPVPSSTGYPNNGDDVDMEDVRSTSPEPAKGDNNGVFPPQAEAGPIAIDFSGISIPSSPSPIVPTTKEAPPSPTSLPMHDGHPELRVAKRSDTASSRTSLKDKAKRLSSSLFW